MCFFFADDLKDKCEKIRGEMLRCQLWYRAMYFLVQQSDEVFVEGDVSQKWCLSGVVDQKNATEILEISRN